MGGEKNMMEYKDKKEEIKPATAKIGEEVKKTEIAAKDVASKPEVKNAK